MKTKAILFGDLEKYILGKNSISNTVLDLSVLKTIFTESSTMRENLVFPSLKDLFITNRATGLTCKLGQKDILSIIVSFGSIKDSVLFIPIAIKGITGTTGVIRYDLTTRKFVNILGAKEGYIPSVKSDIVISGQCDYNNLERIIKADGTVLDLAGFSFLDVTYGDNITLYTLFSNAPRDTKPKYSMIKCRFKDDLWGTISLKSSADFDTFLQGQSENPIFEIITKRLLKLQKETDFDFLGYV